jgi:hypothetical protein
VADGSVVWTCRANYALTAAAAMLPADFTQANGDVDGRKHAVAQKADVAIHTSGTADHVALVDDAQRRLLDVTTCTPQALTAGGTVTFPTWDHEIGDPV